MKASEHSGKPSWSRQSRRHRVIQAKLRSMTHLLGSGRASWRKELVPLDLGAFGHQQPAFGHSERLHRLHGPAQMVLEPFDEGATVMTISPEQLDLGKHIFQRREQGLGSLL